MDRSICDYDSCENPEFLFDESSCSRLVNCFRLLWEQHVYWTRMFIMGVTFDLPDLEATTHRLLRNPIDFANVFDPFYGQDVACKINHLITDHLTIGADLVKASKRGKNRLAAEAERRWYENADDIACFLNQINPYWAMKAMQSMWYRHLSLTKEETVYMLTKKYAKSICVFDKIEKEALLMADSFAQGIFKQFGDCDF